MKRSIETSAVEEEWPLVQDFLTFVNASPSAFHATAAGAAMLAKNGFQELKEGGDTDWSKLIKPKGKYFFTRNQSTLFAFAVGANYRAGCGFSISAAHTDSPVLKVKPVSKVSKHGCVQVGVEPYGGGLWHTWFDRDLSVAGRVIVANKDGTYESRLARVNRAILKIPTLAIHLDREVNDKGFAPNKQTHLLPILATNTKAALESVKKADNESGKHHPFLLELLAHELKVDEDQIRDFELSLYDTQPSSTVGVLNEFISSPRLDNLMMSFVSLRSLIDSLSTLDNESNIRLVALFDNEEVGSASNRGAASNMMIEVLKRISGRAFWDAAVSRSLLVSADMAHAHHPNYPEKHEELHKPQFHKGLVIKHNANQRYATTAVTAFFINEIAKKHKIPVQDFVVRNDSLCGSTIGPILSTNCGMRTVDVGAPQLGMHSIRETCATEDVLHSTRLITAFFNDFSALDAKLRVD